VDTTPRTWNDALSNCQALGLDLASVTSDQQELYIAKQLSADAWINLRNYSGAWKLGSGTTVYNSTGTACAGSQTFFNGECYTLSSAGTQAAAELACQGVGSNWDLTKIESDAENTFITGMVSGTDAWTGASDLLSEGTWRWPDATQFYTGRSCQPDETSLNGVCYHVETASPASWAAAQTACTARSGKLVEITTSAKNADVKSLLGGATDAWIGASDSAQEGKWIWPSGTQFWAGCPSGALLGPTGHCYSNNGGLVALWASAQTACTTVSGGLTWNLASVSSDAENTWIATTFSPAGGLWIGGYRSTGCGVGCTAAQKWSPPYAHWSDGSAWSYTHWLGGQPDTSPCTVGGNEKQVHMHVDSLWNDDCGSVETLNYVCESTTPGPAGGLYNDWASTPTTEPAASTPASDCGLMAGSDGTWSDQDCGALHAYVCESAQGVAVASAYANWAPNAPTGMPSDPGQPDGANCGVISKSTGTWSDLVCNTSRAGVCEGPALANIGPVSGQYNTWASGEPTATGQAARISMATGSPSPTGHWAGTQLSSQFGSVCVGPAPARSVQSDDPHVVPQNM
jgi:hypothetical protein